MVEDTVKEAVYEVMAKERTKTIYDGAHMQRHDGIVHVIDGATYSEASPGGWWVFYAKCHQPMKWKQDNHRHHKWQNRITTEPVTCLACLAK